VLITAIVLWWLFGVSIYREPKFNATMISHRFFGRVTRIDYKVVDHGITYKERWLFSWSDPYTEGDPITECAAIFPERWQDCNGDGKWDTWLFKIGPDSSGKCKIQYRVDTKLSGKPDWVFMAEYGDYEKTRQMIIERRGF